MDNSKSGSWESPFYKFSRLRVKQLYINQELDCNYKMYNSLKVKYIISLIITIKLHKKQGFNHFWGLFYRRYLVIFPIEN